MKTVVWKRILMLFVFSVFSVQCASDFQSNLEKAKFELDDLNYTDAITHATAALAANPGDIETTRILASAYLGRSGIDFFDVLEGLVDLQNSTETNFRAIANVLPSSASLTDLRSAITTLEALSGVDSATITNDALADGVFDLAILQVIEHFALGVYGSDFFGTFDVTDITSAQAASVQDDLVDFDNRLIASGVDSTEDYIDEIRQVFCILEPLSASSGFTLSEFQVLVGCQLSSSPATFNTAAIDAAIANCTAVDPASQSAAVQACYADDTGL